jgi:hypothetical protein
MYYNREKAGKHYCRRTCSDVHCTTEEHHYSQIGWLVALRNAGGLHSLAADKGYDWKSYGRNYAMKA